MPNLRAMRLAGLFLCTCLSLFTANSYSQTQTLKYTYDELGRLTLVEDNKNGNRDYDYDAVGNRTLVTVVPVATPIISPNGGTYTSAQTVSISVSPSDATIRYTTNGSDVTASSTVYTGQFTVSSSATVKAKGFKSGMLESNQASAPFTINIPQPVGTPSINPNGGTFTSAQTVSISVSPSDATIRYTTNGSDVTASSQVYTGQFIVSSSATIKAKGFKSGMLESNQASAPFTINIPQPVGTPSINPNGGTFTSAQTISISVSPNDATIRYTTNGSDVTASSTVYTGQFTVSSSATVKVKGFKSGMLESSQASAPFTINIPQAVGTPSTSPHGGTYTSVQTVSLSVSPSDATIRYTTNGSDVTASSPVYSGPFSVNSTTTVKAKGFKAGMLESIQATVPFTINLPQPVGTPNISPSSGTYTSNQTVSISVVPSDATIRYTTNGSDVTSSSPVYTGPFIVSSSTTVKAKGFKSGMLESAQASTSLTINVSQLLAPTGLSSLPKSITGTSGMYESKWNPVAGATHYILKNINNSEVNTSSSTTVIQPSKGLWVKACNAAGCGPTANF